MVATVRLLARVGQGTLAPWDPTQHLVVEGMYRHVRNPMIAGVFAVLLGEAWLAASVPLFLWCTFFVLVNALYIPLLEEPGLVKRFGDECKDNGIARQVKLADLEDNTRPSRTLLRPQRLARDLARIRRYFSRSSSRAISIIRAFPCLRRWSASVSLKRI